MSLRETSLQALKKSRYCLNSYGAFHTNSSAHYLIHATCSTNINSNFIVSHAACVTLASALLMASKDPQMGNESTAGDMMRATSTVTEELEMTIKPTVTKIKGEVMASYAGLPTIYGINRSTNYYCS